VLIALAGCGILATFFWKIEDEAGQVHYGLLYNYEILYRTSDPKNKSTGLKAILPLLQKIVIPILLPVFNRRNLLQSAMLAFIFAGKLVCQLSVNYRRKIYYLTVVMSTIMELIATVLLILLSYSGFVALSQAIIWTIVVMLIIYTLLTLSQIIVNYQLFPKLSRYLYIHITNELCSNSETETES
jgi:hypothetical protein